MCNFYALGTTSKSTTELCNVLPNTVQQVGPADSLHSQLIIAVGSMFFVENAQTLLGYRAKGREVRVGNEGYQLREGSAPYGGIFGAKNGDIGLGNAYFWVDSKE